MSNFRVQSSGTLGSSDIFGSADQLANEATIFHVVRGGELSLFNNELNVLFCFNQAQVLSTCQIVVSKECWRFFDALGGFYINSTPELYRLFGNNGGCGYPLAFSHKLLRRLHYCR